MPIVSVGSYLPTLNEFIAHWTQANASLGTAPLVLPGGYTLAALTTDRNALETAIIALEPFDNARTNAIGDRDIKKSAIRARLSQFRSAVTGLLYGTAYVRSLPKLPPINSAPGRYLQPFDDMANLWSQINTAPPAGFTGPLLLPTNYTQALFVAEVAALRAAFRLVDDATTNATLARSKRDILLPNLRTRLKQYRQVVKARLPLGDALLLSVPALSPEPGATPEAVALSASWDTASDLASLVWTPSDNPKIAHYAVRYCSPPTYKVAEEQAIAGGIVAPTITTFETLFGLAATGSMACFKVYVVTTDGNEKGSNAVKVIRG